MKKLWIPCFVTVLLCLIEPIAQLVVDPINSFGFLVILLLFVSPICFVGIGLFCATQTKYCVAWAVPLVCVLFWSVVNYLQVQNTSILGYFLPYLAISYVAMLLMVLISYFTRKNKGFAE